jgi:chemotaxis protein CheD
VESRTVLIKMADISAIRLNGEEHVRLKTTLGSCIGIILSNKRKAIYGLAHVMLPKMTGRDNIIGKYADSAIPELVDRLKRLGSRQRELEAYIIGGACMFFGSHWIMDIGTKNLDATRKKLAQMEIPVIYEDIGGTKGRTVVFDTRTREISVRTLHNTFGKRG